MLKNWLFIIFLYLSICTSLELVLDFPWNHRQCPLSSFYGIDYSKEFHLILCRLEWSFRRMIWRQSKRFFFFCRKFLFPIQSATSVLLSFCVLRVSLHGKYWAPIQFPLALLVGDRRWYTSFGFKWTFRSFFITDTNVPFVKVKMLLKMPSSNYEFAAEFAAWMLVL